MDLRGFDPLDAKLGLLVILVIADSQYIALLAKLVGPANAWWDNSHPWPNVPIIYPPALSAASGSPTAGPQTTCELHESACAGKIQTSYCGK